MKNMRKLVAMLLSIIMIVSMMATPIFAAVTGTGGVSDPIVCEAVADMPASVNILAGATVYYTVPAGGLELTVIDSTMSTMVVGPRGNVIAHTSDGEGTAKVAFDNYMNGDVVKFGLCNQNPDADVTVEISIGDVSPAELGSEKNPANANELYNSMVKYYVLNPQLEAGDIDGYWYTFTVEKNGILCLENSSADGDAYQIMIDDGETQYLAHDGVYSNPVSTHYLTKGTVVKINVYAEYDANGDIPATKIYASFFMVDGSADYPVNMKSEGYKACVAAGDTVFYNDGTRTAGYGGKGLVISGYADAIAETVVTVSNKEYRDDDGDGKIELSISGDYYNRPVFSITNNFKWDAGYTLTIVDSAKEGSYCSCGKSLEHIEAVESCHNEGTKEYWYCGSCDIVYADADGTQVVNRDDLVVPPTADVVHMDAVEAGCHYKGNVEYWYCPACEGFWTNEELTQVTNSKNVVVSATGSENLVHFDAVEAGCHYKGNIEYWYCADCEGFWSDEALTQVTNAKNVVISAKGSENVEHVAAVEATCYTEGNVEYWYCADCEGFWTDEALTQITNAKSVILPATHAGLVHFDAVEAGCHYKGNIEYWYCSDCEGFWQDAALREVTNSKNVVVPATNAEDVLHFDAVEAGCHYKGNVEYWYCPVCEGFWSDEALTQITNSKNVVISAKGSENVEHVAAVEATCYTEGNVEYWYCADCEGFWADEALTQITNAKSVILPVTHANLVHFDAVEAGCHYKGNIEYWYCSDCEGFWADAALRQVTNSKNVTVPATAGSENVQHVEAKAPSCYENGNVEHWFCADCECVWTDEALTLLTNLKNVVVPATEEHVWADDFTVDREPDDSMDGEKSKHCTNEGCDARSEITPIPATFSQTVNGVETLVASGTKVTITASKVTVEDINGYAFDYWVVESGNVTLDMDASEIENSFTMPAEDVVINAVTYLIGDCDKDGMVTGSDLIVLQSAIKNGLDATKYLDINNDGVIAATDIIVLNAIIKGTYDYSDYLN